MIHNTAQSYTPPVANIGMHQQLGGEKARELFSWLKPDQMAGRLVLAVCLVTGVLNLAMGAYNAHLAATTAELENRQHQLTNENITLRAMRAALMTPTAIERVAGARLSLQKADAGQVLVFNNRKGRFESVQ